MSVCAIPCPPFKSKARSCKPFLAYVIKLKKKKLGDTRLEQLLKKSKYSLKEFSPSKRFPRQPNTSSILYTLITYLTTGEERYNYIKEKRTFRTFSVANKIGHLSQTNVLSVPLNCMLNCKQKG